MSELANWYQTNEKYLSAAILWLRLRLMRLIAQSQETTEALLSTQQRVAIENYEGADSFSQDTLGKNSPSDVSLEQAAAAMQQAAASNPPPALMILSKRLGLGEFETQILLLCAAMEFDTRIGALCAQAQHHAARPYPTFALALALFDEPVWEALSPERPLRYWQLIEINQPAAQPLTASALRADERVVNYLKGLNYLDDRLKPLITPMTESIDDLPFSQQQQADRVIQYLQTASQGWPMVNLLGTDSPSKHTLATHVAQAFHLTCYCLSSEVLPASWAELETLARLYQRESYLLPIALYIEMPDSINALPAVNYLLSRLNGLVFVDTRESWSHTGHEVLAIEVAKPTTTEQAVLWRQALGQQAGFITALLAEKLVGHFNLNQLDIQNITQIISNTELDTRDDAPSLHEEAWQACLMTTRPRLNTLAQRLEVKARDWDDLILPEAEKKQLQQIINQVEQKYHVYERWGFGRRMSRGLGINALFAGESGTGKTLAAEVIAHQLKLNIYRIDLSQVVSKWVGETEIHLRKLFDAAEDGGTILFFDEADALFGKRSEVKHSLDHYANIEINYLLQRMETFRGLAILATNMKNALDSAFMRRLRFIVNFPFPDIQERKRIWERAFPNETEKEALDYALLAKFNLTGGSIQNIAVNAAFLAASAGSPVTMPLISEAVRGEFHKLDKSVNAADFRLMQAGGTKA